MKLIKSVNCVLKKCPVQTLVMVQNRVRLVQLVNGMVEVKISEQTDIIVVKF